MREMKKMYYVLIPLLLVGIIFLDSCSKDDEPEINGILTGKVTDATSGTALNEANIIVFNADSNEPAGQSIMTDNEGNFSIELIAGNYFVRTSRQGYINSPPAGISAVPFTIQAGQTTNKDMELYPNNLNNIGLISGSVSDGSDPLPGVLVVAVLSDGSSGFSSITDMNGLYTIYNVPVNTYTVKGWFAGYNSDEISTIVTDGLESDNVNLSLTSGATGTLSGQIRNLSIENKDVDVSLVHLNTHETIPGLTTHTSNQAYSITNIPDGIYIARATFENDERVMDPDRIAKFGEPLVEISGGGSMELQFDITGSVDLHNPTNLATENIPFEITSGNPLFTWNQYPSTSDYIIEVTDSNGKLIWGGFDNSGALTEKNISISSDILSAEFNYDGSALIPALEVGRIYRWRVFASKDDVNSDTGWTLISASEVQRGLIQIIE
jgi:hypothetical protein